ncbi:potassium transporter Kup [Spartobacteria bacterium LR76]|nr:potassium transporter Kup [Spartobacteria bacterium LR76]
MPADPAQRKLPLALAALGVVFGDIGTSPLYTFETALDAVSPISRAEVLGVASLIVWSLLLIVTLKYVFLVMRADYHKEGGVFALLALLRSKDSRSDTLKLPFYILLLLFGAALLFGDGTITPAISVLSALEGLEAVNPDFKTLVVPVTVAILLLLFSVQRLGTGRLGFVFGWVMLAWFVTIGSIGFYWIVRNPEVLVALNPLYALGVVREAGWQTLTLMGAVVLAVTGVEALYADMGHFSRKAISLAWHGVALPGLLLNYLGQASLAMERPEYFQTNNPFFLMVAQGWPTAVLVALATVATVVASQALISGVFSLTAQAQELGFIPKFLIMHTSRQERGQVYVPSTNWLLGLTCILLVLTFRSSDNLAAAYGLAVVGTMVITTLSLFLVMRRCWQWPLTRALAITVVLLAIEVPFLLSCLTKFPNGGYFPVVVACLLLTVMLTWHRGRAIILNHMRSSRGSILELASVIEAEPGSHGQIVFITSNRQPRYAAARAFEMLRRGGTLRGQVILLSLVNAMESDVDMPRCVEVNRISDKLWHVVAMHGYMQEPHALEIMARAHELSNGGIDRVGTDTFYVLGRELIVEYVGNRLARWRRALFGFLSRNVSYAPDYFHIPHEQIVEFTWMMRA